jgi:glyoxylase-like metal-dependent hydrolase (beta-lactamase superfamily II)
VSGVQQVADGVYRLGTEWVGWYLCEDGGAVTVVDCGFPGYFDQLPAALSELGHSLDAVAAVVLTHYHSDHVGCAERIRTEADVPVFAPTVDADGVRSGKVPAPGGLAASLWRPRMLRFIGHATRNGGARIVPVGEVQTYKDGEVLETPGRLRVIHTPGHTKGHCSLLGERSGVLFAADALTTASFLTGQTAPRLHPFGEDRAQAGDSLSKLEGVTAQAVVFGHGAPLAGSPADAVAQARSAA